MIDRIQSRRADLAAQLAAGRQQYDQLERALKELDRQLCAMAGGVQELDALLASGRESPAADLGTISGAPLGDQDV